MIVVWFPGIAFQPHIICAHREQLDKLRKSTMIREDFRLNSTSSVDQKNHFSLLGVVLKDSLHLVEKEKSLSLVYLYIKTKHFQVPQT